MCYFYGINLISTDESVIFEDMWGILLLVKVLALKLIIYHKIILRGNRRTQFF